MSINLLQEVSHFDIVDDQESDLAFLRTHVPWVAPEAYLHIIYKPLPENVVRSAAERLRIPYSFVRFLMTQNGARLFSGSLYVYGVVPARKLIVRQGVLSLPPFDIEKANAALVHPDRDRFLAIGMYSFDGSTVCIDRHDDSVRWFGRGADESNTRWSNLEDWNRQEISRLSVLFDSRGHRLTEESATIPTTGKNN